MQPETPLNSFSANDDPADNPYPAEIEKITMEVPEDDPETGEIRLSIPNINQELVLLTFNGMNNYAEEYQNLYQLYEREPSIVHFNLLQNTILDAFPSILSAHIRDLFTPEGQLYGRLRLKEINQVYLTLARMLSAISLSSLEAAVDKTPGLETETGMVLTEKERETFRQFLEMEPIAVERLDHMHLAAMVSRVLLRNKIKPYVKELIYFDKWFREPNEYYDAYSFLETQIRQGLQNKNIGSPEVEALCVKGGYHLGKLLEACAFLCSYQMVTVKDLSVYHSRSASEPIFVHSQAVLKSRDMANVERGALHQQRFTSDKSIFITRNIPDEMPPLNLSPFMIDENAFRRRKNFLPKIYFYNGVVGEKLDYQHTEVLSYRFPVGYQYDPAEYRDLDIVFQQLTFFRRIIGL